MKRFSSGTLPGLFQRGLARLEAMLSRAFSGSLNPMHHLGALTIYFFWVALVTGIYLFIFYRTSLTGAWASVEALTHDQWYAGGIMRSLHRYASNAAVITLVLHVARELIRGRYRGPRWFSWVTGLPLVWIVLFFGITGYWMVWDELAQYVAISSARLLDWLPIFTDPMSRNFISQDAVSSRLFTLIAFIHLVGLPIVVVLAIWFHLLRVRLPKINPPRALMVGSLLALTMLALVIPVHSHGPADLDRVPQALNIDWFYLAIFPLQSLTSEATVWMLGTGASALLIALPWLPPIKRQPAAEVHLPDCTGCGYCAEDCPYGAIDMVPRSDGRNFELQAQVNTDLCVSCGICTGSCPSSSLFRARQPLISGIEMPQLSLEELRKALPVCTSRDGADLLVFGCDHGVSLDALDPLPRASLPCIGMLPPSTIDFALRKLGYAGVVVTGCDSCDCHHRAGNTWTDQRIDRSRQPGLRERVPRQRILVQWLKRGEEASLSQAVERFSGQLAVTDGGHES
jgi:quinol-cytochrome oxidoreductase complex cytochrome b subunit/Pyruvate/2-oxoacid:ferredoxin oxidoreductase delta subunit/coenzyme F420-reducing hydrogenase delta subunit